MFDSILCQISEYDPEVFAPIIELAVEIAREGREGRRIGTLFTFGDHEAVLARSRSLILDPLAGHPPEARHISNPNLRGTIKELAQLDGGFVVDDTGVFISACRYLQASEITAEVPFGLGSRHLAGAAISTTTQAVAVVVSESSVVRVFCHGTMVAEIIPELWLMSRHEVQLSGPLAKENVGDMAVFTPRRGAGGISVRGPHLSEPKAQ